MEERHEGFDHRQGRKQGVKTRTTGGRSTDRSSSKKVFGQSWMHADVAGKKEGDSQGAKVRKLVASRTAWKTALILLQKKSMKSEGRIPARDGGGEILIGSVKKMLIDLIFVRKGNAQEGRIQSPGGHNPVEIFRKEGPKRGVGRFLERWTARIRASKTNGQIECLEGREAARVLGWGGRPIRRAEVH